MSRPALEPARPAPPRDDLAATRALLLVAMAVWGLNLSAVKAMTSWFGLEALSLLRMLVACAALLALLLWRGERLPAWDPRRWLGLATCAVLMVYANQLLLVGGLQRTTATNGAILMAFSPLLAMLMAALLVGERLTPLRLVGVALGFAGVAMVVLHLPAAELGAAGVGDLLVLGAVACYAAGGVLVQRVARDVSALAFGASTLLLGSAMLLLHALVAGMRFDAATLWPGAQAWVLLVFSGCFAMAWGSLVWTRGIRVLGAAHAAQYLYWVPIFGVAFAVVFLGEPLSGWHAAGLLAVIGGTWLGQRPLRR